MNTLNQGWYGFIYSQMPAYWASLMAQMVKNPPAMQEIQVQSLGQEDPLEKRMATHSSILAWRIPWTEEPGELQSMESQRDTTEQLRMHTHQHNKTEVLVIKVAYLKFRDQISK